MNSKFNSSLVHQCLFRSTPTMTKNPTLFFTALAIACSGGDGPILSLSYKKGNCIQETNLLYTEEHRTKKIYRVDEIIDGKYSISALHQGKWVFLMKRDSDYFDDSKTFKYQRVACPGSNERIISSDD